MKAMLRRARAAVRTLAPLRQSLPKLQQLVAQHGPIHTIYDCGSRDALDGIRLLRMTGATELHVFECNPPQTDVCRRNAAAYDGSARITVSDRAVDAVSGTVTFHPIDTDRTATTHADGNPGASSLFVANPEYPHEHYVQKTITVPSTTLDDYALTHRPPDLLWIDLQGAEIRAFEGAARVLTTCRLIHVEVSLRPVYIGQPLLWDVHAFLTERGFKRVGLFLGRYPPVPTLYRAVGRGPWTGDAIYVRSLPKP